MTTVPNPTHRVDVAPPVFRPELMQMIAALIAAGLPCPIRIVFLDDVPTGAQPRLVLGFLPNRFAAVQRWASAFRLSAAEGWVVPPGSGPAYTLSSSTGVGADTAPELFLGWHVILRCPVDRPTLETPPAAQLAPAALIA